MPGKPTQGTRGVPHLIEGKKRRNTFFGIRGPSGKPKAPPPCGGGTGINEQQRQRAAYRGALAEPGLTPPTGEGSDTPPRKPPRHEHTPVGPPYNHDVSPGPGLESAVRELTAAVKELTREIQLDENARELAKRPPGC